MNRTAFGGANQMALGRYYQGGFESPMTRREAALILGIRYDNYSGKNINM